MRRAIDLSRTVAGSPPAGRLLTAAVASAFQHTADGVMVLDPAGTIIFWNAAAEEILGYSPSDVLGRPCWEVLHGRTEQGNLSCHPHCHVLTMAERREPIRAYDVWTRAKDGTARWINISTLQVDTADGYVLVRTFRDVTRQHYLMEAVIHHIGGGRASSPEGSDPLFASLTGREREVLRCLARGEGAEEIAHRLGIHTATVRNHIQSILSKLGVHSRLEAVALAFRSGLV